MTPDLPLHDERRDWTKDVRAKISGFVLAGGRSSRLGQDKALLPWNRKGSSQTLLDHAVVRLRRVCNTVLICADRDELHRTEIAIPDALPGSGPLGGIVAGLEQSATEWNIFLAVDLPFLPVEVFEVLVARVYPVDADAGSSRSSSLEQLACILPQVEGLPQPLCGLYHRALAPGLRRALEEGKFKIMAALRKAIHDPAPATQPASPGLRIEMWDAASFAATMKPSPDPSEWFLNINTPEDWQRALQRRSE